VDMCAVFRFPFTFETSVTPIIESVRPPARIRPYPTGRLFWVALSLALRARLRSVLSLRDTALSAERPNSRPKVYPG
jgi:hypothetical protein